MRIYDVALALARDAGAHAAVLVSPSGELIDGSQATVWVRQGLELLTPLSPPALAGISRGVVFDVAANHGYMPREARITPDGYDAAEEIFLTTAVAGAVPVRGREGDAVVAIASEFDRLFHGTDIAT
jgi:branched-subunit amino acid aminotransferase/4-amino-4-deoxychorismate lyase